VISLRSVAGRISIVEADGTVFLRAVVPVMALPSDRDLILPLMRELLERNFGLAGPARLAIDRHVVVVAVFALPAADLSEGDMRAAIDNPMWMAEEAAEPLMQRYGATTRTRP
jgi:hypothetical protein